MFSKIHSGALYGLEAVPIIIETDVYNLGLPGVQIVGLPDKAVAEAKERVLAALSNTDLPLPEHRTVINLSPADIPKEGSLYDVPIAIGILAANGSVNKDDLQNKFFAGELSLDGSLTKIRGVMPLVLLAKTQEKQEVFIPYNNAKEVSMISGVTIYAVKTLGDLVLHLTHVSLLTPLSPISLSHFFSETVYDYDFKDIIEQYQAKRAMEISAAGFHNILLNGPPGTGKTLLARSMPSILPSLTEEEVMEASRIYSIHGLLNEQEPLVLHPPFRSPHHTTSRIGLIGGGSKPTPGEISLAHRGVLFMDEMAEFPRSVIEALRQPLEDGVVTISRAHGNATFPTRFILVAATNPCPCGHLGDTKKGCSCSPNQIVQYKKRLSGPLLDRIDMHIFVPAIDSNKLTLSATAVSGTSSFEVRNRVFKARERQKNRLKNERVFTNGEMGTKEIKTYCKLTPEAEEIVKKAIDTLNLSVRVYFKLIKLSQTIADLDNKDVIELSHMAEALQYRVGE
ncbi:MAG: YifB family Mg chelatase-like AAA ATPase [Patescibacteria group bacterium]|jgi:magnesium chelatase family protein